MFITLYTIAVLILLVYWGLFLYIEGYKDITRGGFMFWTAITLLPAINIFAAFLSLIMIGTIVYERFHLEEWLSQPLINKKPE